MFMMTKVRPYDAETIDELINHIRDHPVDFQGIFFLDEETF